MRRLPQHGREKIASPRVTLRLHHLKEKKEKAKVTQAELNSYDISAMEGSKIGVIEEGGQTKNAEEVEGCEGGKKEGNGNGGGGPGGGGGINVSGGGNNAGESGGESGGRGGGGGDSESVGGEHPPPPPLAAPIKRSHSTEDEEDTRKKRRKDGDSSSRGKSGSNSGGSPKSLIAVESENEDNKSVESPGPKVPPLKIVIPGASLEEQGTRNGKNGSSRHHLPYVVTTTEGESSSPPPGSGNGTSASNGGVGAGNHAPQESDSAPTPAAPDDQRTHQRVLRSHRSGNGNGNGSGGSGNPSPVGASEATSPRQVSPTPGSDAPSSANMPGSGAEEKNAMGGGGGGGGGGNGGNVPVPIIASSGNGTSGLTAIGSGMEETSIDRNGGNGGPSLPGIPPPSTIQSSISSISSVQSPPPPISSSSGGQPPKSQSPPVAAPASSDQVHPRKRKIKPKDPSQTGNGGNTTSSSGSDHHPPTPPSATIQSPSQQEQQITNCYQLFLNIRKQIDRRRKGLFPVQPKPPQGFKDYLMNRCTYVLAGNPNNRVPPPHATPPASLPPPMRDQFVIQEKERYRLRMQHVIEKEKLVLSVEQEILRVHGRAARALANQALPFSACTILRDEEVYSPFTPEQEEKDRNARSRYNGRLFISWLQDVDDKWEKIKEAMLLRHHNEAESLYAVQKMDWEWKMKELGLCENKSKPVIDETHVPMVHVSDDFDLLPA